MRTDEGKKAEGKTENNHDKCEEGWTVCTMSNRKLTNHARFASHEAVCVCVCVFSVLPA